MTSIEIQNELQVLADRTPEQLKRMRTTSRKLIRLHWEARKTSFSSKRVIRSNVLTLRALREMGLS